jgi:hypothetical protein
VQVWHDWLIHAAVPRNISWLSESISVYSSVILMIDWVLSGSPFSVSIRNGWVLGQHSGAGPPEEIWVVDQGLCIEGVVVHDNWSVVEKTTTKTTDHEVDAPTVCEPASNIEILNGQFSDNEETKKASKLSARSVAGEVPV